MPKAGEKNQGIFQPLEQVSTVSGTHQQKNTVGTSQIMMIL